jgi:hypothetical protein
MSFFVCLGNFHRQKSNFGKITLSSKFGSALIEFISETLRNRGMPLIYTTRSSVLNKYKAKNIKF